MYKRYKQISRGWVLCMVLLGALLGGQRAVAQSGQYGNEWIRADQRYYKVKILRDGLYKLDYQYLTQAGITGVVPNELQVWRRGREIATYVGGNRNTLDASTYLEFYAVHNDGKLDAEFYKNTQDQPHQLFSFYTDTAAYFITWRPGTAARHMQEPVAAPGALHPHRLRNKLDLRIGVFNDYPANDVNFLPWIQPAEGFFMGVTHDELTYTIDSVQVSPSPTGPPPRVEVLLFGAPNYSLRYGGVGVQHNTQVIVVPPSGNQRVLGVMRYVGLVKARETFTLLPSDLSPTGSVTIKLKELPPVATEDYFYVGYLRTVAPEANVWYANRRRLLFQNDSLLAGPATYELSGVPATVAGFDVTDLYNVQRIAGTAGSGAGTTRFVFPGATSSATHTLLLADEAGLAVPPLPARRVTFRTINPAQPTFTIITHPQLMRAATGTTNAAKSYAAYRASVAGGRYDTLMVTSHQLYDQFFYGDKSWLALRHFARWLAAATPNATNRSLFLLGKGIVPSEPTAGAFFARNGENGLDLVPTSSRSASDNMLTADFHSDDFAAKLNTGRLTVTTPGQIMDYLGKMREYDVKIKEYDPQNPELWRKKLLHLVGGENPGEFLEFREYMDKYKARAERPFFGGSVTTIERTQPAASQLVVSKDISPELNPGLGMISFFGHGSNTTFSLDIGRVSTNLRYNNPGKYPVLMYNNCAAGHTFTNVPITATTNLFFEDWLFTPNKGAIAGMGQYGFAYAMYLDPAQDTIYSLLFNNPQWYGKPVSSVYNEAVRRLQLGPFSDRTNPFTAEQLLATVWHGDPTITLYAPPKPDFIASNGGLSISPGTNQTTVTATSTSFRLNIAVTNPAKVTRDSIDIRITRTFGGSGTTPIVTTRRVAQGPQGSGNYAIELFNPAGVNVFGTNTFLVELDYNNVVEEMSEANNTAQLTFTFLRGGVTVLNPVEFAIVGTNRPRLVAQTNDPNGTLRGYEFEADTTTSFNSPLRRTSGVVNATLVPSWQPTLPSTGRDSTVWYWRVRFQNAAPDEDGNWVVSSFRIISTRTAGGWSQSHPGQFRRDQRDGVDVAANGRWAFSTENKPLVLATAGGGLPGAASTFNLGVGYGIITNPSQPPAVSLCGNRTPNILVAVYDEHTLQPITGLPGATVCGTAPQEFYTFGANPANAADTLNTLNSSTTRQVQLANFLAGVPDGAYVALVSANRLRWPSLGPVRTAFSTLLGSQLVNQLQNGDPFLLLAQKRASGGRLIRELGPNTTQTTPPRYSQIITFADTLRTPSSRGTITSTRIGPAKSWENLYHWIQKPNTTSSFNLKVTGIDSLGRRVVLIPSVPVSSGRAGLPLAGFNARLYPYLQLELALQDSVNRQAPQLREWFVTYQGVPEGVVRRDLVAASAYDPDTLKRQAQRTGSLSFPVRFENVAPYAFGTPLRARVEVSNGVDPPRVANLVAPPLAGDATITIPVSVNVTGYFGNLSTRVVVNPNPGALPEVTLFNNELNLSPFPVANTNVPPTLDVAFDGRHILNGEIVSPDPLITIQLNDEDRLRHITDRSAFTVRLIRPGQPAAVVDLNAPGVNFSVNTTNGSAAKLEFRPGLGAPLADGIYTLQVEGRDPSNASAGGEAFEVRFEVVNAAQISHVYPYPNPVVDKTRFVFTLTGQEVPRNLKIQILTLAGRVVRELFLAELGPVHIGPNISDYAWDGTDQYGERLANGTYLYRVALDDAQARFGRRPTAGDQAFKNDWGKLVLLR